MKKLMIAAAAAAMLAGSPVSAGEITGNGKYVPGGANGQSECSYSGLNDTPEDGLGFVQVYSFFMKLLGIQPGDPLHPGQSCRGN